MTRKRNILIAKIPNAGKLSFFCFRQLVITMHWRECQNAHIRTVTESARSSIQVAAPYHLTTPVYSVRLLFPQFYSFLRFYLHLMFSNTRKTMSLSSCHHESTPVVQLWNRYRAAGDERITEIEKGDTLRPESHHPNYRQTQARVQQQQQQQQQLAGVAGRLQ